MELAAIDQGVRQPREDGRREAADDHRGRAVDGVRGQSGKPPGTPRRNHHGRELHDEMQVETQVGEALYL